MVSAWRAILLVLVLLVGHAALLLTFASPLSPELLTGLALTLLLAAGLCLLVLRILRQDFDALAEFVRRDPAVRLSLRSHELQPLFHTAALLRKRSAELEAIEVDARSSIEAAERVRVGFVASMGHDLKGPLNSIVGFADLLVMDHQNPIARSQRQSVELIRRSAEDLLVLLDQILDWARLEAGRIVLDKRPHPSAELIEEAIGEACKRSADRGLSIDSSLTPGLPDIEVDRVRFVESLLGLLDHATRTPNGPRVVVSARAEDDALQIQVRDPALLIRQADQRTFFEAFRPSFAPSGQRIAGLGLGPALARALMRAHGGDVWFESSADLGTIFRLSLPVRRLLQESPDSAPRQGS